MYRQIFPHERKEGRNRRERRSGALARFAESEDEEVIDYGEDNESNREVASDDEFDVGDVPDANEGNNTNITNENEEHLITNGALGPDVADLFPEGLSVSTPTEIESSQIQPSFRSAMTRTFY